MASERETVERVAEVLEAAVGSDLRADPNFRPVPNYYLLVAEQVLETLREQVWRGPSDVPQGHDAPETDEAEGPITKEESS